MRSGSTKVTVSVESFYQEILTHLFFLKLLRLSHKLSLLWSRHGTRGILASKGTDPTHVLCHGKEHSQYAYEWLKFNGHKLVVKTANRIVGFYSINININEIW